LRQWLLRQLLLSGFARDRLAHPRALFCSVPLFLSSRETYNHLISWLEDARKLARPDVTMIVVGNQMDRKDEREVTLLEASRFAQENGRQKDQTEREAESSRTR
jgi:GTPase SAR1 family protein